MISFFNNIWQSYGNRLFSSLWPRCIGSAKIPLCALWLCSLFDMMSQCPLNDLNWRRGNVLWLSYDICMGSLLIRWKQTKTFKVSFNNRSLNTVGQALYNMIKKLDLNAFLIYSLNMEKGAKVQKNVHMPPLPKLAAFHPTLIV